MTWVWKPLVILEILFDPMSSCHVMEEGPRRVWLVKMAGLSCPRAVHKVEAPHWWSVLFFSSQRVEPSYAYRWDIHSFSVTCLLSCTHECLLFPISVTWRDLLLRAQRKWNAKHQRINHQFDNPLKIIQLLLCCCFLHILSMKFDNLHWFFFPMKLLIGRSVAIRGWWYLKSLISL